MRPISILHLRDTYEVGGPGKTIVETFRAIDADRFKLHVGVFCTRRETVDTPFVAAARQCGMPVHDIRGFNQYDPRMVPAVVRLVEALGIDILHAHEVKSDIIAYLVSRLRPIPIVTTVHGWIGNSRKQKLLIRLDKRVARKYDCVIAVSGQIRDQLLAAGVPEHAVRLVHNAIVLDRYRSSGQTGFLEALIGCVPAGPVIAAIGRLSPEKGHADFVDALAIVASRGWRPTVLLAGDGPERSKLVEKVQALGLSNTVCFPGYVDQPARLLEEVDLMVLPSHTEGLPNVALEALALEVPVLATHVGGTPEIIEDGKTGRLVAPRSPTDLADALVGFLTEPGPWKLMAQRGRAMVEREFTFDKRTRKIEQIYTTLLGKKS